MSLRNPDDDEDSNGEQNSGGQSNPAAPPAASKADVERVRDDAADEIEDLRSEIEDLHSENEKLREENEDLRESVVVLDQLVNYVYQYGACRESTRKFNEDMSHVMPENQESDDEVPLPFQEGKADD